MRTSRDALLSLSRYMSRAFPDYEIGFFSEQGTFARPGVSVRLVGPQLGSGSRHTVDLIQPAAVYVYPPEGESVEQTFDSVMLAEETLWQAFHVGIQEGKPMRVPLFDYEGMGVDEESTRRRYPDYLRIVDLSIDRAQSPEDEKKWTVTAELRLSWRRAALLPGGTRLAQTLKSGFSTP